MDNTDNKMFQFLSKYLMGPMGKLAQMRIVRGVMAAGMASIPFTIVGSMFLIVSVIPQSFPALAGIWSVSFDKITNLYMLANTATMGILALYFCIVFGYEYTRIQAQEEKVNVNPLNGALLSMMAFFMCVPELLFKDGTMGLINIVSKDQKIIDGWEMGGGVTRLGTTGIFTAIIMGIVAVKIYTYCVKKNWTIKMPETVPVGVINSFIALIPTALIALTVIIVNGILVFLNTDIFKMVAIPFSFVTNLTNTWLGLLVVYFIMHALWIVGIHGATIVTSFLTPIVLSNMAANQTGANLPFAGEFNNSFVTIGGSGATIRNGYFYCLLCSFCPVRRTRKSCCNPSNF